MNKILFIATMLGMVSTITAQTCLRYNTLSLDVTYRDVCVAGRCMNSVTFMPDFDFPSTGYRGGGRTVNGYRQNFCAAVSNPNNVSDVSLRPWGCDSPNCSDSPACDFNARGIADLSPGNVEKIIGFDDKPVWKNARGPGLRKSIASNETFWKWYHDSNATITIRSKLNLTRHYDLGNGQYQTFQFSSSYFFPIDNMGYMPQGDIQTGDDSRSHNFGFTTHIHADFAYTGGERFTFRGDDDVWVFLDGILVIDLGGVHNAECRSISLDEFANNGTGHVYNCVDYHNILNTTRPGEDFSVPNVILGSSGHHLDIFHAERHYSGSSFAMSTSIGLTRGDVDYTTPTPLVVKFFMPSPGTPILLPDVIIGQLMHTPVSIGINFPPYSDTTFHCRILSTTFADDKLTNLLSSDTSTIPPPITVNEMLNITNQATWANVSNNQDYVVRSCITNSADQPIWNIRVTAKAGGSGYLYCMAENNDPTAFNDYAATGVARGINFYTKWIATSISGNGIQPTTPPPTIPPTTPAPTTPSTTLPPTTPASTTLPPTTPAPTTSAPTAWPTSAPTTLAPTTPPTTGINGSSTGGVDEPVRSADTSGISTTTKLAVGIPVAVGGVIVVLIVLYVVYWCWRKRRSAILESEHMEMTNAQFDRPKHTPLESV